MAETNTWARAPLRKATVGTAKSMNSFSPARRCWRMERLSVVLASTRALRLHRQATAKSPPEVRSLSFSGRRAQVLHALLVEHERWFGINELAQRAMVSPATASQVVSELERFDWLVSRGKGPGRERHLHEPAALLDHWVKHLSSLRPTDLRRYYVANTKPDALLVKVGQAFDAHDALYAVSHEAAAQCYAPYPSTVSQVRIRLLIGPNPDAAITRLGARVVSEGANLAVIEAGSPGELLFRERVGGVWLVSPIQVYLDLVRGEGRSKDMAEHLRKERIGF